jgi:hypothetical protein
MEFKHYGEIIHKIRQDRNMSLKEAAGDAITPNNLSRFEKGLATVKVNTFFEVLNNFNLDGYDYVEIFHIQDKNSLRAREIIHALSKNDKIKARQILGKKSDWGNVIEYYILKLDIFRMEDTRDESTPDVVEAINYLVNYMFSIDTLYIRDFLIIELLLTFDGQYFELKFLEYLEKLIVKGLEETKHISESFSHRYTQTGTFLVRTYSRYGYYDKAEKLIYKLKIALSEIFYYEFSVFQLFYLNIYEVFNLLRQNNPKAIERANALLHYIDAQNDLFPLPNMITIKNSFTQEVQRLNKTGIPFPMEDEE